jgi:predicted secreted protein with PEFG-CTERM motif
MKTKAISSIFVLFAIAAGMASMAPAAFADHPEVTISTSDDAMNPACEPECYVESTSIVEVGSKIIFSNPVGFHSFTSGTGFSDELSGVTFDTGILQAGDSGEWTPANTGEVPYYCSLHPYMYGVIIVQDVHAEEAAAAEAAAEEAAAAEAAAAEAAAAEAAAEEAAAAEAAAEEAAAAEAAAAEAAAEEAAAAEAAAAEAAAEEAAAAEAAAADAAAEQALADAAAADVELIVEISESTVMGGTQIELDFNVLHVNYDMTATQNGEVVFEKTGLHSMENIATHQIDAVGSPDNPIDVKVVSLGIGAPNNSDNWTGPVGQVTEIQVVPEFGTIAMMVLAVAIISIVAVTAKSRVVPRF